MPHLLLYGPPGMFNSLDQVRKRCRGTGGSREQEAGSREKEEEVRSKEEGSMKKEELKFRNGENINCPSSSQEVIRNSIQKTYT